jgi:hypothetical protein
MNLKQKTALLIGIIIIILMGIYPPWCIYYDTPRQKKCIGYAFITTPAITKMNTPYWMGYPESPTYDKKADDIDYIRLVFQWAMVVIVTSGFLLMFKDKKKLQRNDKEFRNPQ